MATLHRLTGLGAMLMVLLATNVSRAQTVDDEGIWSAFFGQGDLYESDPSEQKLKWWFDGHARFLDDADGFNQSIVRPGLGWTLNKKATLWAGYAWIRTSPLSGSDFDENRLWQQLTYTERCEPFTFGLRSRLEQRFLETGDETGWRFRQFFSMRHDLPKCEHIKLVAWDELFVNLNDTDFGARSGLDQNRLFVGLGFQHDPNSDLRTEVGYLNQTINTPSTVNRSHHILSINVYWTP